MDTARLIRKFQKDVKPAQLSNNAVEHAKAARTILESYTPIEASSSGVLCQISCMSVELALKAIFIARGGSADSIIKFGHDIEKVWRCLKQDSGQFASHEDVTSIELFIYVMNEYYKSNLWRYLANATLRNTFDPEKVVSTSERWSEISRNLSISTEINAKRDLSRN